MTILPATKPLASPIVSDTGPSSIRPPPASIDYLTAPDIFHLILRHLDIATLARSERVSKLWLNFIRKNSALWRLACIDAGLEQVDLDDMGALAVACRNRKDGFWVQPKADWMPAQTPWRFLCADRLPGVKAWHTSSPELRNSRTQANAFAELPMLGAVVALQEDGALMCDTHLNAIPTSTFDTAYSHIASSGRWFAGARSSSQLFTCHPRAPPTCLELWTCLPMFSRSRRALTSSSDQLVAPHGVLQHVRNIHLPPVWAYDVRMMHGARGTILALLCADARYVDSSPRPSDTHWVSARGQRAVHLWFLDEGARHEVINVPEAGRVRSLCLTDDYIVLPSAEHLHIYTLDSATHTRIPLTPVGASLASVLSLTHRPTRGEGGNGNCTPYTLPFAPYTSNGIWHEAHGLANFGKASIQPTAAASRDHLIYVTERGALAVVHNYREVFPALLSLSSKPDKAAEIASASTLLIACFPLLSAVEVSGDRVVGLMKGRAFTLDSTSLPSPPSPTKKGARFPDLWAYMWREETDSRKYKAFRSAVLPYSKARPTAELAVMHDKYLYDLAPGGMTRNALFLGYRGRRDIKRATLVARWGEAKVMLGGPGIEASARR